MVPSLRAVDPSNAHEYVPHLGVRVKVGARNTEFRTGKGSGLASRCVVLIPARL